MTDELSRWVTWMGRPKSLLVVDDDSYVRMIFASAAEGFHVAIDYAPSAQEAKKFLASKHYDFVFLDMKLEHSVSGMEVLQFVDSTKPSVNVVIMSGSVNLHDLMEEANHLGVLSFIKKPTQFTRQYIASVFSKMGIRPVDTEEMKALRFS